MPVHILEEIWRQAFLALMTLIVFALSSPGQIFYLFLRPLRCARCCDSRLWTRIRQASTSFF